MTPLQHAIDLLRVAMRPRKQTLYATIAAVVLFNILEVATPKILQLYIDAVAGNPLEIGMFALHEWIAPSQALILLPLALLVFAVGRWLATWTRAVYQTKLGQGALFDLRCRIYNTMQHLSFAYHDASHSGTLISNVVEDVNYISMFMQRGLMLILESLAYVIIAYAFMLSINPVAGLVSLGLFLLGTGVIVIGFKYGYAIFARTKVLFAETVGLFSESMEGHLVVKGFGAGARITERYHQQVDRLHQATLKERYFGSLLTQSLQWASVAGIPAILITAIIQAEAGLWSLTAGKLFLLFYLQNSIRMRTWRIGRAIDLSMRFSVTAERIGKLLHADDYLDDRGTLPFPAKPTQIEARNVSFSYGNRQHSLHNISLTIHEGQTIGLVGKTGAGKSTLALLLSRFYDPDSGTILLNRQNLRNYPLQQLRNTFAFVFQDTFLFSASIRDNIAYGHPDARYEDIVHAASVACIHDFIMSQPQGYDTIIGERGVTLSGGQRQRISIARAILRQPRFLILDACTSALDTATEKAIQDGLKTLSAATTCIIIAHRRSSIKNADQVYVLDGGNIIEAGSPEALNQPGTHFSRMLPQ